MQLDDDTRALQQGHAQLHVRDTALVQAATWLKPSGMLHTVCYVQSAQ